VTTVTDCSRNVPRAGGRVRLRDRQSGGSAHLGLAIRVGLHAGEYKVSGAEVFGLAFTSRARLLRKRAAGEFRGPRSAVKDF